jgi:glycosyltransferase involved in cell wall biosynthesis
VPLSNLVSIIVPCFNAERFLAETLNSALGQTYPQTEVIVIDDGSIDKSRDVIRSYAQRLRAEFGPNRGASAARNLGTALARGEFIQYLDADDLLPRDAISRRVEMLKTTGGDIAYSDWERLIEGEAGRFVIDEKIVRRIEDVHPKTQIALITEFWAPPAALTFRRTIVDKIGGWKEWLPIIQDARFLQDAGFAGGKFVYTPGIGAQYRVHRGVSLSRRRSSAFVEDVFRNACDLQSMFEARGSLDADERRALASIYNYVSRDLFFNDSVAFQQCVSRLYEVEQGFRLSWPKVASLTSSVFGFECAATLLSIVTKLRNFQRLRL